MKKGKTDLDIRPNTAEENKRVLSELRKCSKVDFRSSSEINKIIARFNTKNTVRFSKNSRTSLGPKQEKIAGNVYGPVDGFPVGSWWGIRMDCSRDGVHEPFDRDIGEGPFGAVSLCTSHSNADNDVDLGDYLTVTTSELDSNSESPPPLRRNQQNHLPLRLVRSYNLSNEYAPKTGYRYDGLYVVVGCWIGVAPRDARKRYKFALARLDHQDPAAWRSSPEAATRKPENPKAQRTRCNVARSLNDRSDNSRTDSNDEKSGKKARSRSLTLQSSSLKSMTSNHESDIVTRCISKKSNGQSVSSMISVPYPETCSPAGNRLFEESPVCKFQNTNISIRTDLYDSSNATRQEPRKTTPMTFCRTYKNSRLPIRASTHSNVVSMNLNSCGPCPKDNAQESLIQSRSGIAKSASGQSPSSEPTNDRSTPKSSSALNAGVGTNFHDEQSSTIDGITRGTAVEASRENIVEEEMEAEKPMEKGISDRDGGTFRSFEGRTSLENHETALPDENELTEEEFSKESRTDIDSLSPDQMLNFIVKQKYHPTAKLLIGSVIGLATGESTILRAYESLMSRKNRLARDKSAEIESLREKDEKVEPRDYDRKKKSIDEKRNEDRKVSKIIPSKDRLMRKMKLRRTRVSKRLVGAEKKSSSINVRASTSQRLRKSNLTDKKSQQAFSKSTLLKKSKKCVKKRRGELANLVIDANIGPLIRGPRNRRLRCKTHIFAKRHGDIVAGCCAEKNRIVAKGGKKEMARIDLTRKSKVSPLKPEMADSRFVDDARRKARESEKTRAKVGANNNVREDENPSDESVKAKKRKLSRARSHEKTASESRKTTCDTCKNIDVRRAKMIDAATQFSTPSKDAGTCTDLDILRSPTSDNYSDPIKIEWIDVDVDVKSENNDDSHENDQLISERNGESRSNHRFSIIDRTIRPRSHESSTLARGLSAFVPVDISDGDSRIARLRSLGFKPIQPAGISQDEPSNDDNSRLDGVAEKSLVESREVDELFNKYTSEETTMVGYMDQELHYQDIEDEVSVYSRKRKNTRNAARGGLMAKMRKENIDETEIEDDRIVSSNEEDSEVPWHGWKQFAKNKEARRMAW